MSRCLWRCGHLHQQRTLQQASFHLHPLLVRSSYNDVLLRPLPLSHLLNIRKKEDQLAVATAIASRLRHARVPLLWRLHPVRCAGRLGRPKPRSVRFVRTGDGSRAAVSLYDRGRREKHVELNLLRRS